MRNFTLRKFNSFKLISLVLLLTVTSISSFAQVCGTPGGDGPIAITGSINTYFPVGGDTDLNVGAQAILLAASPGTDSKLNNFGTTPISVGDLILIIQMQDATIDYSNNQAYGSRRTNSGKDGLGGTGFLNINNTGIFEYVIATNNVPLGGGNLTFKGTGPTGGVRNSFFNAKATPTRGQRTFQIVRVPQYSNLKLNSTITTPPFNGVAGGVIAFNVSGTFNFNGNTIDGSARGFRGGYSPVATTNANDSKTYVGASNNTAISGKGEGIAGTPRYMWDGFSQVDNGAANEGLPGGSSGRGAPANAGGGGNDHNSGGGGGGNGGYGGLGGAGWQGGGGDLLSAKPPLTGGGRPGFTSFNIGEPELTRLIMGGGGGAGDANNAINGVKGGVGGAIILINAGNIQGSGIIKANGGPGAPGSYAGSPDGAGGGGAGGSVFLNISNNNTIATNVTIEANGGKGGNTLNDLGNSHGPGGGGGGGIIRYNVPGTGVTINPFVTAGASGGTDNGSANGESHGAQPGEAGYVKSFISSDIPTNLQVNASCFPILGTKVKALTTSAVCGSIGEKVTYEIQIKNSGAGNAAGVLLDFTFPTNIEFDAATASYSTEASGPSGALSSTGTANNPLIGNFNIAQNGIVTIILVGKVAGTIAAGTYSVNAQALYLDPTRTTVKSDRKITAAAYAYGTVNKNYEGVNQIDVPGTNFNGDSSTTSDVIKILDLPVAPTVKTTQGSCEIPTGTITVTAPANGAKISYTLTGTNPVTAPVNNLTGIFPELVSGTYQVTTTNANGCTSLPTTGIQIIAVSGAPAAKGVSICVGDPEGLLTSSSTCIIDWYTVPSGGTKIGSGNSFNPVNRPNSGLPDTNTAKSVTFYAACPSNTNCRTAVNFVINAKPTITAVDSKSLCDSGSVTLGATASSGTINWYTAVTGGSLVATGTNSYTTPSLSATTDYYVEAVANGCISSARTKVTATVNTTPKITGTTSGSRCGAGTVPLSASASAGTISWYSNVTGGTPLTTGTIYEPNVSATTTYYVDATNNGCTTGSRIAVAATVIPLPTAYTVTGGGASCSAGTGFTIGLDGSQTGVNYQLKLGSTNDGAAIPGTGSSISFGAKTAAGTYTVVATNASTTCTAPMTGNAVITINALPTAFNVTGTGAYCAGGSGVTIGLDGSQTGVNYQLKLGSTNDGAVIPGTGSSISFGAKTAAGTYTVVATNASTTCTAPMTGNAVITINALPTAFNVTGTGAYCAGGSGVTIGLDGSQTGVNYQLKLGSTNDGAAIPGTGSSISFGAKTAAGTYTVVATNASTTCTAPMTGNAVITINALPTAFNVTGTGAYCAGGSGVTIGLDGSQTGVNYQLKLGSTNDGAVIPGTGSSISFGAKTAAGTYTVVATNASTTCTAPMTGNAVITINALPTAFNVTGTGAYCAGGSGVTIGLDGSQTGVNYQLKLGSTNDGAVIPGTGSSISFGAKTAAGTYTVVATNASTTCTAPMTGNAVITINALPTAFNVTGTGAYCAGGSGVTIGLDGSQTGVNYQLKLGSTNDGAVIPGTGSSISFGAKTAAGTYTVVATNASTTCTAPMTGNAVITINALPTAFNVTGTGAYCAGGSGVTIGLDGSQTGVNYQLKLGSTNDGAVIPGTGSSISFGAKTAAGTYTVVATNASTTCTAPMTGNAVITINALPTAFNVTGTGAYCAGGSGVTIGLDGSQTGVNYQLKLGSTNDGAAIPGTGSSISFGAKTAAGTYTVVATNASTTCTAPMTGNAVITINALPTAFNVTGTGAYCAGGSGVTIGLDGSQTGVNYQLKLGSTNDGAVIPGTGSSISFGAKTAAGTYTVVATNASTTCTAPMTGNAVITINALPTAFNVTGTGAYCAGGSGVTIGLDGSQTGVNYQLKLGSTNDGAVIPGTGSSISFGAKTAAGTYTVVATNASTTCTAPMTGNAVITINALPTAFNVTGTGAYCAGGSGVTIGLDGSQTGVNYQLKLGSTNDGAVIPGTGSSISFGAKTAAGTYTVVATNASTTCTAPMTGNAVITINALPTAFNVTGTGAYCAGGSGVTIGLDGSQTGVNYQLKLGSTNDGAVIPGTGSSISFGAKTAAGTYTVVATNASTTCTAPMTGNAVITINALPTAFNVTGTGAYCAGGSGVTIGLDGSQTGVNYQLKLGSTNDGAVIPGTGSSISFGAKTAAGTYTVVATNASTTCTAPMTGNAVITINALPTAFNVTGTGAYCAGGSGVTIGLDGSQTGVNYQLKLGSTNDGAAIPGTGSSISFGAKTAAGTYTVVATNASTTCTAPMTGNAVITINALPTAFNVTGTGAYCAGGSGVTIGLDGSQTGVNYQLKLGSTNDGAVIPGTGSSISFGAKTAAGTYTVVATNASTTCTAPMTGNAVITINALPTAFNVTGTGAYCAGGSGVTIGLDGSQTGVNYQLKLGSTNDGAVIPGTGSSISFGAKTAAGTYTVVATNASTTCTAPMTGNAVITINALPTAFNVTGTGAYCAGGSGVTIGLDGSQTGVNYQLKLGSTNDGAAIPGTGSSISFGAKTAAGTYTVVATNASTTCTAPMTGNAVITINALPTAFNVTGTGAYCAGGSGVTIGLDGSQTGVNYQLKLGSTNDGAAIPGTGSSISFGAKTAAGTYTVVATNASTTCTAPMTGNAVITINALPTAFNVTGTGAYCAGGSGVTIGLDGSQTGVNYQLKLGSTNDGAVIPGTGSSISFGAKTAAGTYTVVATNASTTCTAPMTGNAVITINALPTAFNVTGTGAYCAGGSGVTIGLDGSQTGVNYQLKLGSTNDGAVIPGTGSSISFGAKTAAGTYTVVATNASTTCTAPMTGNAVITINALPTAFNVTGTGAYCAGGSGVTIGLDGSQTGVNYQLKLGSTNDGAVIPGTGSSISFGAKTAAGTYTVVATNASTTCTAPMTGNAVITINALPTAFNVTGTGAYCAGGSGVTIGLDGSQTGVNYQLKLGSTNDGAVIPGTGSSISFGAKTAAGTYTVVATNASTTCTAPMTGNAVITINALPTAFNVTGTGAYCAGGSGVTIGLDGSQTGVNYQLKLGSTNDGAVIPGTGSSISFGAKTAAGTYTVVATNASTTCTAPMTGNAVITINALPTAFNVTGTGAYCAGGSGVTIGLDGSQTGVNYQLKLGSTNDGAAIPGTGSSISFGAKTAAGTYTVVATNASTTCTAPMTGNAVITINALPTAFNVTGTGAYCAGGSGVTIGLDGSQTGVNYQLKLGSTNDGAAIPGTGSSISFGAKTAAGTYTVVATNASTTCTAPMTGNAVITINALPTAFNVTGTGAYCAGGSGVTIGLDGSQTGVNYQLKLGSTNDGAVIPGTGSSISFGAKTAAGTYTVVATNASTTCTAPMTGNAVITINALPTAFNVTGTGAYCAGGSGVTIGLDGSQTGVNYQLKLGSTNDGAVIPGTGSSISFGAKTAAGTYTVVATNASTTCTAPMTGNAVITINALPTAFNVTGTGAYCAGGSGVTIGLDGSQTGVNYQLKLGSTNDGAAIPGTGSSISFGAKTAAGTYTVVATNASTTCTAPMTGNAVITINALPTAFNVTGTGAYCAGGSGVTIGLDGSQTGVNYQLKLGSTNDGAAIPGTGSSISFGAKTAAGTYTVVATNASTTCTAPMTGNAVITINALPTAFNVTGTGAYCAGGSGVTIGLDGSQTGVNYQLKLGSTNDGAAIPGTGSSISFGAKTAAGTYTVVATNASTTCTAPMTGNAVITINALPTAFNVTGTGAYCAGGSGVTIGLDGSQTGVNYQLKLGSTNDGAVIPGTGSSISFGAKTAAGTYTVVATNASTTCTAPMTGNAVITINALPTAFNVTGTGAYCAGGSGVTIGLDGSQTGVNYQLKLGSTNDGAVIPGTGSSISFGAKTAAGTYTVVATNASTTCTAPMTGNAVITINVTPTTPVVIENSRACTDIKGSFTISNYNATYNYVISPSIEVVQNDDIVIAPIGSYVITALVDGCYSDSSSVTINSKICANADNTYAAQVPGTTVASTVGNVTDNDTLNGVAVTTANTDVTPISSGPLKIDAEGVLSLEPNTVSGSYTITYEICEKGANPDNCKTATATVVVKGSLVANDDSYTATPGTTVATTVGNVTANDKLNGVDVTALNTAVTPKTTGPLSIDASGVLTLDPNTVSGTYTITYQICEKGANPVNCDTAEATVVVKGTLVANDDSYTATPGTTVATTVGNVTANDKLNGVDVTALNTAVTPKTTGPLSIDVSGVLTLDPNTVSGTYTITYQICEKGANPVNCDTAEATVVVKGTLVANDDSYTATPGTTVATTVGNVTANDKLNGEDVTALNTAVTPKTTGPLSIDASGVLTLDPNTVSGTYTITYQICEKGASPDNCKTATVTVVVKGTLVANDDSYTAIPGTTVATTVGNVTANDKLNGEDVTALNTAVTPKTTGPLSIDASGVLTLDPNTVSGTYTITYQICEKGASPDNCKTATVTVVVKGTLVANDDSYTAIPGTTVATTVGNVTANDKLNGEDVTALNTAVTPKTTGPLSIDASGVLTLDPNTVSGTYTITYQICEKGASPDNCKTATVTVVVKGTLVANDDSYTAIPGTTVATTVGNVTANDKLNGEDVTALNTAVTPKTTGPLSIDASGVLTLDPNTVSGTYTITYQICEKGASPDNCKTATATVVVKGSLDAKDDNSYLVQFPDATVVITVGNVKSNDTLNGKEVTATNTIVTPISSGPLKIDADGVLTLEPNTVSGSYTITYEICEKGANPANCDSATVTVVVGKSVIKALTENTLPINGSTGGKTVSLIDNVTLNGNSAVIKNSNGGIILTVVKVPTGLTLNPDGTVTVKPGTPVGNYEIEYTICEYLNPDNCVTVKSYVPVISGSLQANNDNAGTIDTSKGQSSTTSIFDNDTLNGSAVNPADVILTTIVSNPNLILKADGTIEVKSGTPTGNYELTYRICEALNASNCSQAVAKISVVNNPPVTPLIQLIINNDGPVNVDGINGSLEFINVFDNDLLKGLPINPIDVILNAPQNAYFEFNQDGTVNVKPNTPGGNYTMTYQVCEKANPTNCASATLSVFVEAPAIAIIKTAVFNDENNNKVADAGETITYKFKVTNTGNVPLVGVTVLDPLPGVAVSGQAINLGVNESDEYNFTATYKITQSDINKGSVSNQASVQARSNKGVLVDDLSDDDNNTGDQPTVLDLTSCVIKVFNAFSPNGDEKNKRFYIQGLECYPDNTVEIYNRWGILVYDVDNYNNEDRAFVGYSQGRTTVKQSEGLPEGTYFYILKYKDSGSNSRQLSGYLYINK